MSMKQIFWWVAILPFIDFTPTHFYPHSILPLLDFTRTHFYPHPSSSGPISPVLDLALLHPDSNSPSPNFTCTWFHSNPFLPSPDFTLFSENFTIPSNRTACTCGPSDKRLSKASIYCCNKSSHFKSCKYHNFLFKKNNSTSSYLIFKMELYIRSFKIITQFNDGKQLKNLDEAEEFSKMLEDLLNVHGTVIDALSTGFRKWTSIPDDDVIITCRTGCHVCRIE